MQNHVILNYLDLPPRILIWPIAEVIFVITPALLGLVLGFYLSGISLTVLSIFGIRTYKKKLGPGRLSGFLYWYLPPNPAQYPVTPPSYIREWIG
jgi:type IV conjugative transfer system protein TraL